MRYLRGMKRESVAAAAGLSVSTYRRLEIGETTNPPIRYLVNLAMVFDCTVAEIIEDEHVTWLPTDLAAEPPSEPRDLWLRNRKRSEIGPRIGDIWGNRTPKRR